MLVVLEDTQAGHVLAPCSSDVARRGLVSTILDGNHYDGFDTFLDTFCQSAYWGIEKRKRGTEEPPEKLPAPAHDQLMTPGCLLRLVVFSQQGVSQQK